MKETVLLIGPTSGKNAWDNMRRFQKTLEAQGYDVINPCQVMASNGSKQLARSNKDLLISLAECDKAVCVSGWIGDNLSIKLKQVADMWNIEWCHLNKFIQIEREDVRIKRLSKIQKLCNWFDNHFIFWSTNPNKIESQL